jgi:hypothetical protein
MTLLPMFYEQEPKVIDRGLEAEIEGFLSQYRDLKDNQDRRRVVRNGYLPEREIQTGIGPVAVKVPRARDRQPDYGSPIRFKSSLFSTVRLWTAKVRSCFSSKTVVTMAFKLCQCAQNRWQRLHSSKRLAEVVRGIKFVNGIEENRIAA